MADPREPLVSDEAVQAALAGAIAWQKQARQPLWTAPATAQVRAMLEAAAPLIAGPAEARVSQLERALGHYCPGTEEQT